MITSNSRERQPSKSSSISPQAGCGSGARRASAGGGGGESGGIGAGAGAQATRWGRVRGAPPSGGCGEVAPAHASRPAPGCRAALRSTGAPGAPASPPSLAGSLSTPPPTPGRSLPHACSRGRRRRRYRRRRSLAIVFAQAARDAAAACNWCRGYPAASAATHRPPPPPPRRRRGPTHCRGAGRFRSRKSPRPAQPALRLHYGGRPLDASAAALLPSASSPARLPAPSLLPLFLLPVPSPPLTSSLPTSPLLGFLPHPLDFPLPALAPSLALSAAPAMTEAGAGAVAAAAVAGGESGSQKVAWWVSKVAVEVWRGRHLGPSSPRLQPRARRRRPGPCWITRRHPGGPGKVSAVAPAPARGPPLPRRSPRAPPGLFPRPQGGGWWRGGREATRLRGGSALAVGGGSRVAAETDEGVRAGGDGARRADSYGVPKSQYCEVGKPPPGRQPLSAPFASTLSTLNLLASGLWWVFPLVEAFILEPPPLPSRTPPIKAVPALRALQPGTWRMPSLAGSLPFGESRLNYQSLLWSPAWPLRAV